MRFVIATSTALLIAAPAFAQVQQTQQQPSFEAQVNVVTGQINRNISDMANMLVQQKATIDQLKTAYDQQNATIKQMTDDLAKTKAELESATHHTAAEVKQRQTPMGGPQLQSKPAPAP